MSAFLSQMRWQFILLHRSKLIIISVVVTAIYGLMFLPFSGFEHADHVLTLLIFNDPALIGLFFIGLMVILERNQQVISALFVTPLQLHHYLLSRIVTLCVVGLGCSLGMTIAILGPSIHYLYFGIGILGTVMIFGLLGLWLVSYTSEFLLFMLRSIPLMLIFSIPLLNYYQLTDIWAFKLFPTQGALDFIIAGYPGDHLGSANLLVSALSMLAWIIALYALAFRTFKSRLQIL